MNTNSKDVCINCKRPVILRALDCTEHITEQAKKLQKSRKTRLAAMTPMKPELEELICTIANTFDLPESALMRKSSDLNTKLARYLAVYIVHMEENLLYWETLVSRMGISSPSSHMQAVKTVQYKLRNTDSEFCKKAHEVFSILKIDLIPA